MDDSRLTFVPQNACMRLAVDFDAMTTTVQGNQLQLVLAGAQDRTTGVGPGTRSK
jgi:hypothetical protein